MDGRLRRSAGVTLALTAALGLGMTPAAFGAGGVSVSAVSSLQGNAGTLTGTVVNDLGKATRADVAVRIFRRGTRAKVIGRTRVNVAAHGSASYSVDVALPKGLAKGNYYL